MMLINNLMLAANVSVPMALEDYLPVLLAAIGWVYVARMIKRVAPAWGALLWAGLIMVTLGGLSKATWKLILAASTTDLWPLNTALFVLMCPGFIALGWALWRSAILQPTAKEVWAMPLIVGLLVLALAASLGLLKGGRGWFALLIGLTTLGNLATAIWLIRRSLKWGLPFLAFLFFLNIAASFALARLADQTVTMQWIKQGITTLSQAAFLFAAMRLYFRSLVKLNSAATNP
jgi:hypothetical protein